MHRGLLAYFPDALAYVAHVSYVGNEQHNPGQELHWAREKSTDHGDCIVRHQAEFDKLDDDGLLHAGKVAWRALAQLQELLEKLGEDAFIGTRSVPFDEKPHWTDDDINSGPITPVAAKNYDGYWNTPDQSNGVWKVDGNRVMWNIFGAGWKEALCSIEEAKEAIDKGEWVPNQRKTDETA